MADCSALTLDQPFELTNAEVPKDSPYPFVVPTADTLDQWFADPTQLEAFLDWAEEHRKFLLSCKTFPGEIHGTTELINPMNLFLRSFG